MNCPNFLCWYFNQCEGDDMEDCETLEIYKKLEEASKEYQVMTPLCKQWQKEKDEKNEI